MQTRGHRVNVHFETPDMELPPIDQSGETIEITCGLLKAKLHRERFICPGINRQCIEYNGDFITPKTFYVMADKGSLKDWKNAIRINGKKIRRYIDTGELDFYSHADICTGRCKSRMGQKTSTLVVDNVVPSIVWKSRNGQHTSTKVDQYSSNESLNLIKDTDSTNESSEGKPSFEQLRLFNVLNLQPGQNGDMLTPAGDLTSHVQYVQVNRNIEDEDDDAKKASKIVNELGMKSKLDMKLCAHKFEFDRQRDKLDKEMEQLKKKVTEYEQRKEMLKRKSDCYEQLLHKKIKGQESTSAFDESTEMKQIKLERISPGPPDESIPYISATELNAAAAETHLINSFITASQASQALIASQESSEASMGSHSQDSDLQLPSAINDPLVFNYTK